MASINVSGAFRTKNNVLRKLLHKGTPTGLRLWGPTSSAIGGMEEKSTITTGWNHKQSKNPETGVVIEAVKINLSSELTEEILSNCDGCDILYADTFDRFTFEGKSQLKVISQEWSCTVTPNKGDKTELTPVGAVIDTDSVVLTDSSSTYLIGY